MPDALSKTVPIWCTVINRTLFPTLRHAHELFTPPNAVSRSEHAQIETCIEGFVTRFRELGLPFESLAQRLQKPLRAFWITPGATLCKDSAQQFSGFHSVVLCTASKRVPGNESSEGGYIQGAGDDSEGWALGLTATHYWANRQRLLASTGEELPEVIAEVIQTMSESAVSIASLIQPTTGLFFGNTYSTLSDREQSGNDAVISVGSLDPDVEQGLTSYSRLQLSCGIGKKGSRELRSRLPGLSTFFSASVPFTRILIQDATEGDLGVGVALVILCKYVHDNGKKRIAILGFVYMN